MTTAIFSEELKKAMDEFAVPHLVGGDCATCENNDADIAGDSGACVMGHGLCDPPQNGCLDYVPANSAIERASEKTPSEQQRDFHEKGNP